jgi:hypothetical protein
VTSDADEAAAARGAPLLLALLPHRFLRLAPLHPGKRRSDSLAAFVCAAPDLGTLAALQDPEEADMPVRRERLLEAVLPEMPFGESGEAAPSLIPYQVMSSDSVPASPGHPVVACPLLVNVPCDVMQWRGAIGACTCVFSVDFRLSGEWIAFGGFIPWPAQLVCWVVCCDISRRESLGVN